MIPEGRRFARRSAPVGGDWKPTVPRPEPNRADAGSSVGDKCSIGAQGVSNRRRRELGQRGVEG